MTQHNEPRHIFRDLKPLQGRYSHDPHSPSADAHNDHLDSVGIGSKWRGFPVANKHEPLPRVWP